MNKELEAYLKQVFELARSLIIKHEDIARIINQKLEAAHGLIYNPNDETTWKYYMNLNGDYFGNPGDPWADEPMTVASLDNGVTISFDKATLSSHPVTLEQYRSNRRLRDNLISQYPHQLLLIRGILFPVDYTVSIPAKDGQILYYDDRYVEENEEDLIDDLQVEIDNIIARWYVRGFTLTDAFYLPGFLGFLATRIPVAILNIRLKYSRTYQAHSFHVKNFLSSNHSLEDIYPYVNRKSLMWLYRNLPYITNSTGYSDTLDVVIQKLIAENAIDTGTYLPLQTKNPDYQGFPEVQFTYRRLNEEGDLAQVRTLEEIIGKEVNTVSSGGIYGQDSLTYRLNEFTHNVDVARGFNVPTKILELSTSVIVDILHINPTQLVIDNWMRGAFDLDMPNHVRFVDPNDGVEYIVNNKEAIMVFFRALSKIYNIDNPRFTTMTLRNIVDPNVTVADLQNLIEQNLGLDADATHLHSLIPTLPLSDNGIPGFDNQEELHQYLSDLFWGLRRGTLYITQNQDTVSYGILRMLMGSMFTPVETDIGAGLGLNNGDLLSTYSQTTLPKMDTPGYDARQLVIAIVEAATGYTVPLPDTNNGLYDTLVEALDHITSYSTQKIANFLSANFLANLDYPFSRLSGPLSDVFWPEITLDCTPRGLEPSLRISCSELVMGLNVILFDETKINTLCYPGTFKSPTFCTPSAAWAISDCFGTSTWNINACSNADPNSLGVQDNYTSVSGIKDSYYVTNTLGNQRSDVVLPAIACTDNWNGTGGSQYTYTFVAPVWCSNADPSTPTFCGPGTPVPSLVCVSPDPNLSELDSYTSKTGILCSTVPRPRLNMECGCGNEIDIDVLAPPLAEDQSGPGGEGGGLGGE